MRRPVIFVLLALFAASVMAIVVYSALRKRDIDIERAKVQSLEVVVAARELPIGAKIDQSAVRLMRWSRDSIPPGAFTDLNAPMNRITRSGFVENEPIIADRLFGSGQNTSVMPLLIPKGMRAMSVAVDEVSDIAGFVEPHSRVDVVVSMAIGGPGGNQPFAKIVLQNVEVLAVAQQMENTSSDKPEIVRVVTLLVSPADAERLTLASHEGALRLAMRNFTDQTVVATAGAEVGQILRPDEAIVPATTAPEPRYPTRPERAAESPVEIEIMRNGKSVENVAFVHRGRAPSHHAPERSPAESAAPVVAPADSTAPADAPTPADAGLTEGKADAAPRAASRAPVAAATPVGVPALATIADHVSGLAVAAEGFTAPHARTIDIP